MSKIARRNQAKQLRIHHQDKRNNASSIFQGQDGAPKHVAVVPLSLKVDTAKVISQLSEDADTLDQLSGTGAIRVSVDRFRRNLLYLPSKYELITALDICRLADWVILVLVPDQQIDAEEDQFIRALEGQGISNVLCAVQGLEETIPAPKRSKVMSQLKSDMATFFPLSTGSVCWRTRRTAQI